MESHLPTVVYARHEDSTEAATSAPSGSRQFHVSEISETTTPWLAPPRML
jgi:hypothetical protein